MCLAFQHQFSMQYQPPIDLTRLPPFYSTLLTPQDSGQQGAATFSDVASLATLPAGIQISTSFCLGLSRRQDGEPQPGTIAILALKLDQDIRQQIYLRTVISFKYCLHVVKLLNIYLITVKSVSVVAASTQVAACIDAVYCDLGQA